MSNKSLFVSTKAQPSSNRMNLTYFQESLGFWEKSWINDKGPSGEKGPILIYLTNANNYAFVSVSNKP